MIKKGKIIKGIAGFYYVHDGVESVYECKAKGAFRNKKVKPLVGDNVEVEVLDEEKKLGNILAILPRNNCLIRPACANVDQALVIFAGKDPEPNLNLLDRFLVMMEIQGIPCHICFSKTDLLENEDLERFEEIYRNTDYPMHFVSTYSGEGIEEIRAFLKGKTTVMAGPSGVGKSSLMNCVNPDAEMETGEVSEKIRRGRHTTRHTELFYIGEGSFFLDTPGFSSLYVEGIEANELRFYFPEINELEGECRFQGCIHDKEPDCAVKTAVQNGQISSERYENYHLIYEELKNKKKY